MGWCTGNEIAWKLERILGPELSAESQRRVAAAIVTLFEDNDADDLMSLPGFIGDEAHQRMYAEYYGAPANPEIHDEHISKHDGKFVFNGRRWVTAKESS